MSNNEITIQQSIVNRLCPVLGCLLPRHINKCMIQSSIHLKFEKELKQNRTNCIILTFQIDPGKTLEASLGLTTFQYVVRLVPKVALNIFAILNCLNPYILSFCVFDISVLKGRKCASVVFSVRNQILSSTSSTSVL
jgi:hypothetical protein